MNFAFWLLVSTMVLPFFSFVGYRSRVPIADIIPAAINVAVAFFIYFYIPQIGIFFVDRTTWVLIVMVTSVYLLSLIYSGRYFKDRPMDISEDTFYFLLSLFTTSMIFSLEINNLGLMWVGIEATTISSALLLIADKTEVSLEAAWRYIIIVSAGVTFAFFSIILIYYSLGTLEVSQILAMGPQHSLLLNVAVAIALIGFGTKVGVFPVHTWLPDAHSESPSPVSAMFSGVLLPTALYVLYRIYEIDPMRSLFVWTGVVSVAAASIFLGYQRKYKRMFAYSSMENMSLALIGFAVGGAYGVLGALLLLVSHSFGKAGAFYSSGNILRTTGKLKIDDVGGLWNSMPATSGSLLLSSFSVTGAPPFGVFFGEFLILYELLTLHYYVQFILVVFFLMTAFISVSYNVTRMVFRGESRKMKSDSLMSAVALFSSALSLAIGIFYVVIALGMV